MSLSLSLSLHTTAPGPCVSSSIIKIVMYQSPSVAISPLSPSQMDGNGDQALSEFGVCFWQSEGRPSSLRGRPHSTTDQVVSRIAMSKDPNPFNKSV